MREEGCTEQPPQISVAMIIRLGLVVTGCSMNLGCRLVFSRGRSAIHRHSYLRLTMKFTVVARMIAPNRYERRACRSAALRMTVVFRSVSETW